MDFVFLHQSIVHHDAIGTDVIEMYDLLSRRHGCYLYCEHLIGIEGRRRLTRAELIPMLRRDSTVLIYHHSIFWEDGERLLDASSGNIIFKYHNITPPIWFTIHRPYWELCVQGREQTYRFLCKYRQAFWLSDSRYNMDEVGVWDESCMAVVPPFSTMDRRSLNPTAGLLKNLIDLPHINLLFSGRFVPNKGHALMVRVVAEYARRYDRAITLNVIGKLDPACKQYYDSVMQDIEALGVGDLVCYKGQVSDEDLLSYYLGSDAYLCCSDHEGFCVPIVESQFSHLPVVAKAKGAVPETLGLGQLLFGEDPGAYADALHRIKADTGFRRDTIRRGYTNYSTRFSSDAVAAEFRKQIERITGAVV